nr:hypothetical protein [Tanacetum cinerariifolium]
MQVQPRSENDPGRLVATPELLTVKENIDVNAAWELEEVPMENVEMDDDYDIDHSDIEKTLQWTGFMLLILVFLQPVRVAAQRVVLGLHLAIGKHFKSELVGYHTDDDDVLELWMLLMEADLKHGLEHAANRNNGNGNENRNGNENDNGNGSHDSGGGNRKTLHTARGNRVVECQVKYTTCTLLGGTLTWWNSHVRIVRHDATYEMTWKSLMKMMIEAYYPRSEIKKLEIELWSLTVKGVPLPAADQRTLPCFAYGNQWHYHSEWSRLNNQNYGNQTKNGEARGRVYALEGRVADQDPNNTTYDDA